MIIYIWKSATYNSWLTFLLSPLFHWYVSAAYLLWFYLHFYFSRWFLFRSVWKCLLKRLLLRHHFKIPAACSFQKSHFLHSQVKTTLLCLMLVFSMIMVNKMTFTRSGHFLREILQIFYSVIQADNSRTWFSF